MAPIALLSQRIKDTAKTSSSDSQIEGLPTCDLADSRSAMLNPRFPPAAIQALELADAAHAISRQVVLLNASTDAELDAAFAALVRQRAATMLVAADPFFDTRRDRIIAFAAQQEFPAMYHFREYAVAGGLMSYE